MLFFNKTRTLFVFVFIVVIICASSIKGEAKDYILSPENIKIGFNLAATLHTVHGSAQKFKGHIRFPGDRESGDYDVYLSVSVQDMETGNQKRDKKMHNYCLEVEKYPEIVFQSTTVKGVPKKVEIGTDYEVILTGDLTIREITKSITIPVKFIADKEGIHGKGSVFLDYIKDFDIKDPSVFLLRVAKKVEVFFSLDLPYTLLEKEGLLKK